MSRIKVFSYGFPNIVGIEDEINAFLSSSKIEVKNILQTESVNDHGWNITITVWYVVKE